jgi:hypothetical protein
LGNVHLGSGNAFHSGSAGLDTKNDLRGPFPTYTVQGCRPAHVNGALFLAVTGQRVSERQNKRRQRWLWRAVGAATAVACAVSNLATAADDKFAFSDDRTSVKMEVRGMPLDEVLHRLLHETSAEIQYRDPTLENEPITGSFNGPIADVVGQVLSGINFAVAYSSKNAVARVIVLGKNRPTAVVAPSVVVVPQRRNPSLPASAPPQQTAQPAIPLTQQAAQPAGLTHLANPPRRSHDD